MSKSGIVETPDAYLSQVISDNTIMIFTRADYRYHNMRLENHLKFMRVKYAVAYLDQLHDEGKILEKTLFQKFERNDLPFIFVNGNLVDLNDFISAFHNGCIEDWIQNHFPDVRYDLIIVAENPGVVVIVKTAIEHQKKVILCDNLAPSDVLLYEECIVRLFKHFEPSEDKETTWSDAVKFITNVTNEMNDYRRQILKDLGVTLVSGPVSLLNGHEVKVGSSDHLLSARNILLALDKWSIMPKNLLNLEKVKAKFTPETLFTSMTAPGKTLVLGNSFMTLLCTCLLQFLGVEVTLMSTKKLMKHYDQEAVRFILDKLTNCGVAVVLGCKLKYIKEVNNRIHIKYMTNVKSHKNSFDSIVVTPQLRFNFSTLNLSNVGIKLHPKSKHILVNEKDQTSASSVFAIGGAVHGRPRNMSMVTMAGRLFLERIYHHRSKVMDYHFVPNIPLTWSLLEYGYIGLTEERAIEIHGSDNIVSYTSKFLPVDTTLPSELKDEKSEEERKHFAKLVCLKPEETVIGLHIVSQNVADILFGYTLALKKRLKKSDFDKTSSVLFSNGSIFTKLSREESVSKKEDISEVICKLILKE